MGIEFMVFNHETKTRVDLGKGPWGVLQFSPELMGAELLTLADELNSEGSGRRGSCRESVIYYSWVSIQLYAFFRNGTWGVSSLPVGPIQSCAVFSDAGCEYLKYSNYALVGSKIAPLAMEATVIEHFSESDLALIEACTED